MPIPLFAGTYTNGKSEGIYLYNLDTDRATCEPVQLIRTPNPSYLAFNKTGQVLYAVNESSDLTGDTLSAFRNNNGTWEPGATLETRGVAPCHISLSNEERHLFTANYTNGSLSVLELDADGNPVRLAQFLEFSGSGPHPRQESAHLHCTCFSRDGRYLFATDLGADRIYVYRYNTAAALPLEALPVVNTKPGGGPRHLVFNNQGTVAYVIFELTAQVAVYSHKEGKLDLVQIADMEDADFNGEHCAAAIQLSNDGNFLYASNRGSSNAISVFKVNHTDGSLQRVQRISSGGEGPRCFSLTPCNTFLLAAHQYTNDVQLFARDTSSGRLDPVCKLADIDSPVFLWMQDGAPVPH